MASGSRSGNAAGRDGFGGLGLEIDARVRVLAVLNGPALRAPLGRVLEKSPTATFELAHVDEPGEVADLLATAGFELCLLEIASEPAARRARLDAAHALATRLPVVLLTGTESLALAPDVELAVRLEAAELPQLLLRTLRRTQRLGSLVLPPVFCRLDHPGA